MLCSLGWSPKGWMYSCGYFIVYISRYRGENLLVLNRLDLDLNVGDIIYYFSDQVTRFLWASVSLWNEGKNRYYRAGRAVQVVEHLPPTPPQKERKWFLCIILLVIHSTRWGTLFIFIFWQYWCLNSGLWAFARQVLYYLGHAPALQKSYFTVPDT
jgi:hypothetical protein